MAARRQAVAGGKLARGAVVLVVAGLAVLTCAVEGRENAAPRATPQLLDALARQYRDAGLPLPPPDATPTLLQAGTAGAFGTVWAVGFRVGPGQNSELPGRFLVGTETGEPYVSDAKQPATRPLDPTKGLPPPPTMPLYGGWTYQPDPFPVNHWLALAVQCHLRGDDRLAGQIFERGLTRDAFAPHRLAPLGNGGPRDSLAATAWNHWMDTLLLPGTDRREILARLEKLSAEFPALAGEFQRDYLASLRLTLVPSRAVPDSAEALIDGLIDHNAVDNPDDERLITLGFGAVPALIAHLDDRRLTRGVADTKGDGGNDPQRVGEVVGSLLRLIAGNAKEFLSDSPDQPPPWPVERDAVARWWTRASAMGEETYMTREYFPPEVVSLAIVSERYPQRLGEIYARLLKERPDTDAGLVAQAISECATLGREERRRLLRLGTASANLDRCFEALGILQVFDPEAAVKTLIERLDGWPADARAPYATRPPEARVSGFLLNTDSAEVWRAYERALFRAGPALRMEMLGILAETHTEPPQDVRQLATLDLFLDDPEVRVIRKEDEAAGGKFEGYAVTSENRRLSVGNFVVELLAKMLRVKPPPGPARTDRWWAKYRETVRAAVDEHEREALQTPMTEP